jgi:hypothetical protein
VAKEEGQVKSKWRVNMLLYKCPKTALHSNKISGNSNKDKELHNVLDEVQKFVTASMRLQLGFPVPILWQRVIQRQQCEINLPPGTCHRVC